MFNQAYAAGAAAPDGGASSTFILLILFVFIFYFLMWRPQSKRAKEHNDLISNLSVGDEIVTSGGVVGRVSRLHEAFLVLDVGNEVTVNFDRKCVARTLPKGTIKTI